MTDAGSEKTRWPGLEVQAFMLPGVWKANAFATSNIVGERQWFLTNVVH